MNCLSKNHADKELKFSTSICRQTSQKEVYKSLYFEKLVMRRSAALKKLQHKRLTLYCKSNPDLSTLLPAAVATLTRFILGVKPRRWIMSPTEAIS